jgi:hypothetical protein
MISPASSGGREIHLKITQENKTQKTKGKSNEHINHE